MPAYIKPTDTTNKIKLDSNLIYALWTYKRAHAGQEAELEVKTSMVGNGAKIKITCKNESGKKLDKAEGVVFNNQFTGKVLIPENVKPDDMVFFEAELSKQSIKGESNSIPVRPAIKVTKLQWDRKEVKRKDVVTLSCRFQSGVEDGDDAVVLIYEHNPNSCDLKVVSIPTVIKDNKIEMKWEFDYQDDTKEIPSHDEMKPYKKSYYNPQFYFVVVVDGIKIGEKLESGLLLFKDWIEFTLDAPKKANKEYTLYLPDGSTRKGKLNEEGKAREEDLPPGPCRVEFEGIKAVVPVPQYMEIGDSHFHFNSAVFLPNRIADTNDIPEHSVRSSGIVLLERVFRQLELTDKKLLVSGHADTVGSDADNTALSTYRAQAVYAVIIGDRELFKTIADAPHIANKEKKQNVLHKDKLQIADWAAAEFGWPCSQKAHFFDPIKTFRAFQKAYNAHSFAENPTGAAIPEDGDWGPLTWGAAFDCYELKLSRRLMIQRNNLEAYRGKIGISNRFVFTNKPYVGCGEFHPLERKGLDNYESATNRRVELLFFKPGETPEIQCVNEACDGRDCLLFDSINALRGKLVKVMWEYPDTIPLHCERRKMTVQYPGFVPGSTAIFTVMQILCENDTCQACDPVGAIVVGTQAEAEFEEQGDQVLSKIPSDYGKKFSYFFTVQSEDFFIASARLAADGDLPHYG
jgi:hypothetical protein